MVSIKKHYSGKQNNEKKKKKKNTLRWVFLCGFFGWVFLGRDFTANPDLKWIQLKKSYL